MLKHRLIVVAILFASLRGISIEFNFIDETHKFPKPPKEKSETQFHNYVYPANRGSQAQRDAKDFCKPSIDESLLPSTTEPNQIIECRPSTPQAIEREELPDVDALLGDQVIDSDLSAPLPSVSQLLNEVTLPPISAIFEQDYYPSIMTNHDDEQPGKKRNSRPDDGDRPPVKMPSYFNRFID